MGILESLKNQTGFLKQTTNGFYFGAMEAEGENIQGASLLNYFEDYLGILRDLSFGKFIFIGRKGAGKSAIAKFIVDSSALRDDSYAKVIRVSDFGLESWVQNDKNEFNENRFLFEWLILVNLVKMIVAGECGQFTKEYDKMKKFLAINRGITEIDSYCVREGETNSSMEVKFGTLSNAFGGIFKKYFGVKIQKAPFYELIEPLKEVVKKMLDYPVNKETEFWILFDDLDVYFNPSDSRDHKKMMELIRVAKEYNNEIFQKNKSKVLIFLRDDIRDLIISKYADSAKTFSSYETRIDWFDHGANNTENEIPLKKMANKRISMAFERKGIEHADNSWDDLFSTETFMMKSSFRYILDFTFYRPRDIITFLSTMSDKYYGYPITGENIKKMLSDYLKISINEIKSELALFFNPEEVDLIFKFIFPEIAKNQNFKMSDLNKIIEPLSFHSSSDEVINTLLNYSLLVLRDPKTGTMYFNYRYHNDISNIDINSLTVSLPKVIYHNIKRIH